MQKGVQTDATCNIQQCWELLVNNVAFVCTQPNHVVGKWRGWSRDTVMNNSLNEIN